MQDRKNALLLFAKLPEPGKVKTRLSVLKDGIFSPEDASELFEAMLLDVIEISLSAFDVLKREHDERGNAIQAAPNNRLCIPANDCARGEYPRDVYKLYISTAPAKNRDAMIELIGNSGIDCTDISVITDSGTSFDEHYNDAFSQVWEDGADCILSMGADMPALSVWDVVRGFDALHELDEGIVISPDQEMGVSIIGWTAATDFDHTGVFYNQSGLTVLPAYIEKARANNLPVIGIPPVPDVDTVQDLAHNITLLEANEYSSDFDGNLPAKRTIGKLKEMGCFEVRVPPNELRDSRDEIDAILP